MIDKVNFTIKAGRGGSGSVAFFPSSGGPCGGSGGRGGDVYVKGCSNMYDLSQYTSINELVAQSGFPGGYNNTHGKSGKNLIIRLPIGTKCSYNDESIWIVDELEHLLCTGTLGGSGNKNFVSSVCQAPRSRGKVEIPEPLNISLEYFLNIDIAVVGSPNSGTSTIFNHLSQLQDGIDSYLYTTKKPRLGIYQKLTIADIPSIGFKRSYLHHVHHAKIVFIVIDDINHIQNIQAIEELCQGQLYIVINKSDKYKNKIIRYIRNSVKLLNMKVIINSSKYTSGISYIKTAINKININ